MRDPEKTVGRMADQAKTVFLSYIDSQGFPATRAMLAPREREGIRVFWFSTNTSSQKVAAFRENPRGSVYFVDRRFFRGVTDPDYCVLKFTAERGRYYSNFKSEDFLIPD